MVHLSFQSHSVSSYAPALSQNNYLARDAVSRIRSDVKKKKKVSDPWSTHNTHCTIGMQRIDDSITILKHDFFDLNSRIKCPKNDRTGKNQEF